MYSFTLWRYIQLVILSNIKTNVNIRVALSVQMLFKAFTNYIDIFKIILSHSSCADMFECLFVAKP